MASADVIGGGNVEPRALEEEMRTAYLDYAMSVIVGRALPDVRDGLKPVHRRVLYAMNELGLGPTRSYAKCAKIVGEVMGNYHPHGDSAIYDTLVRMAQEFSMRNELVDGQGNFGSIDDDPAAAMRYCVVGDTRVSLPFGSVRIDELAVGLGADSERAADFAVLDRLGRPVHVSRVFNSGAHPTLKLRTSDGHQLRGSHNHPVLCLVDVIGVPLLLWKRLDELKSGDRVVFSRSSLHASGSRSADPGARPVPFLDSYIRAESRDARTSPAGSLGRRDQHGGTAVLKRVESEEARRVLRPLLNEDYCYSEVLSVEPAGVETVYSLRVDSDDHSFLTNGFVSHNTEARLARIATEMLRDLDMDTVDFATNYDGSRKEPLVLPARFPNLLVNGSSGIAVGMATNIPPHNLTEVIAATIAYIDDPSIETEGLMKHIKGPDFPTGGIILGREGIREAYETGRGRVRVQARAHIEPLSHGKEAIVVTELPFMVKKGGEGNLITKIAELATDKRIPEISDIIDQSDKRGMRLVIELKRDAIPKVVLNKLYKHTPMQNTFGVNMVALVDNVPRTLNLRSVIHNYVAHQREVIVRRTKHELSEKEARAHILEGLLTALDHLDEIIELIRASRDRESAREQLMGRFELTAVQATAILDLRLSQLTALEADSIKQEHADVTERIAELRAILGDESRVLAVIKEELTEIGERFGDTRRTEISHAEGEIDIEDLIADQQMVITITQSGYIKSLPLATYRQQQRGGRGVTGMDMKDGDFIEHLFVCSSHDYLLFFSNRGKVYRSKVYELPEAQRTAKGRALVNILPLAESERIQAVVSTRDFSETQFVVFATRNGTVKKTELAAYNTPIKADGIIAINIRDDDELLAVRAVDPGDEVIMVSRAGLTVRFAESDVRGMGRDTTGVRGMDVGPKGRVIAMDVARDDMDLLVVTENGYGKRTLISQYRKTNRGAKGVKTIKLTEQKGALAGALVVREHQELVFISVGGMVQRTSAGGISQQGRSATGVRVMNLRDDDVVSAVALVVDTGENGENGIAADADALDGGALDGGALDGGALDGGALDADVVDAVDVEADEPELDEPDAAYDPDEE